MTTEQWTHAAATSLSGRVALVTGGTRGVGRTIAGTLAATGAAVVVVGRNAATAADACAAITSAGGQARYCLADVADQEALLAALAAARAPADGFDILVCAAGMSLPHRPLIDYGTGDYRACFDLNVLGVMHAVQAVLPGMMARRSGRIVAIGGTYGHRGVANSALYAASKWAVRGLIKSVAVEAGPFGVTANIVSPGGIDGDNLRAQFARSAEREGLTAQAVHDRFAARSAMRTLVDEEDVAATVLHAVSRAGRLITGQDLLVDGGASV